MLNPFRLYRHSFSGIPKSVWLLALVTLVNRSGTMVVPFLSVYLTTQLRFSFEQAGFIMGCFGLGSVAGGFIGGQLIDRFGPYWVQFFSLVGAGVLFLVMMGISSVWGFSAVVFLAGMIGDAFRPAVLAAVSAYSPPENSTRSMSLIRLSVNLGFFVGPSVGGLLAQELGYNWLFWVDGITCLGAAAVFILTIKNIPHRSSVSQNPESRLSAYRDWLYLGFIALIVLNMTAFMQLFSALPVYQKQVLGLSESQIGVLLALNGLLIVMIEMPLVYLLETRFAKLSLVAIGAAMVGLAFGVLNWIPNWAGVAVISLILLTIGELFCMPFSNSWALVRANRGNKGQYMGLYSIGYSVSQIIAPALGLYLVEQIGFGAMWYVMMGLGGFSALGFWLMSRLT